MVTEFERGAFGFGAAGHGAVAATNLDGVQSAGLSLTVVVSAAVHGTLDAGIGFFGVHKNFLLSV
jgi:hypothetical protein